MATHQQLIEHLKKFYPELYNNNLESVPHDNAFVSINKICFGRNTISLSKTIRKTCFNLNKKHFVEKKHNDLFKVYQYYYSNYQKDLSGLMTEVADFNNCYKALFSENGIVNRSVLQKDNIIYNINLKMLDDKGINALGLTIQQYKSFCEKVENDNILQDYLNNYYYENVQTRLSLQKYNKTDDITPAKLQKHIHSNYSAFLRQTIRGKIKNGDYIYPVNNLHIGIPVVCNTKTNNKTWLNLNKEDFIAVENKPATIFIGSSSGGSQSDYILYDIESNRYKPICDNNLLLNNSINSGEQIIFNIPLSELYYDTWSTRSLKETELRNMTEMFEQDEFLQHACKQYFENKMTFSLEQSENIEKTNNNIDENTETINK